MARTKFTARSTTRKYYVKNDANQSNCKYTQIPGDSVTIEATRIINTGDKIKLFYVKHYSFDYSIEHDYPSDQMKQSTSVDYSTEHDYPSNLMKQSTGADYSTEHDYPLVLMKQSTGAKHKRKLTNMPSDDYGNENPILDYARQKLEVKIAMAKREIYLWEEQIKEIYVTKKKNTGDEKKGEFDCSDSDLDVKKNGI